MNQDRLLTVGILIFDDVEVLDFCGPFEVFSVARPAGKYGDEFKLFNVVTIAEENRIITCRGGLLVKPHATTEIFHNRALRGIKCRGTHSSSLRRDSM